ncbi:MAG: flotillin family protein, partial [Chloroflexi bacterium]|nr:flotillin family protein [Chloroflexota bacterium]
DRKIAEEQRKTFEVQQLAQEQRQLLVRETAMANIQQEMVEAEQGVNIAELEARAEIKHAEGQAQATRLQALGESEAIRATGNAKAEAYRAGVNALGPQGYTALQLMQIIGERNVRVVPDVAVSGQGSNGLVDGLLASMLQAQFKGKGVTPKAMPEGNAKG